jgi:16S rRNA (cytidine1402-2'-O)-methyltransferase
VLQAVDVVAAEDTRSARKLLGALGVRARLVSYHDHNETARAPGLLRRLLAGSSVALLPEAGTPLLSDPGFRLVRAAIEAGVVVRPLPGPSAILPALAGSGLPPDAFVFVGFLPRQRARRRAAVEALADRPETIVAFEAPHRILESLEDCVAALGDRGAALAWNLSKPDERILRGTLAELRAELAAWEYVHGEMTLVIEGLRGEPTLRPEVDAAIAFLVEHGLPPRGVRDALAPLVPGAKRELYERALKLVRERNAAREVDQ